MYVHMYYKLNENRRIFKHEVQNKSSVGCKYLLSHNLLLCICTCVHEKVEGMLLLSFWLSACVHHILYACMSCDSCDSCMYVMYVMCTTCIIIIIKLIKI